MFQIICFDWFIKYSASFFLQVISYDSSRGGVNVITEKGDVTTSFLIIQHADISDSGKYSCSPSNADVASVRVHVLNGKLVENSICQIILTLDQYDLKIHFVQEIY